ncbi:MAG TPA: hypothetical protein VIJ39_09465 [Solirubrobacteraceae bacterium]
MRFGGLLVALIVVVGIAGTVLALHSREGNTQFVSEQQSLALVGATQLERLILTTSDPRPGYGGPSARGRAARCVAGAPSALGNPWSCVVRYPRAPDVRYRVTVHADRSIFGSGQPEGQRTGGVLTVSGCCVADGL